MGQGRWHKTVTERGQQLAEAAGQVLVEQRAAADRVRSCAWQLREQRVLAALDEIPVARLSEITGGRLRVKALETAGLGTVRRVHEAIPEELLRVPGVGCATAARAKAAAGALARATHEATAVRIDPDRRTDTASALITALHPFVQAGPSLPAAYGQAAALTVTLNRLLAAAAPAHSRTRWCFTRAERRSGAREALASLEALLDDANRTRAPVALARAVTDLQRRPTSTDEAWRVFVTRPAEFYTVLGQLTDSGPADAASTAGHLPRDLAAQVRAQPLDVSRLTVSLRGYQAFGARYALARRKVILGDEMGLGKTVQAIAALAHLAASGEQHFAVVCPASVLVNWLREIETRSTLTAFRLHGPDRRTAYDSWREHGGVAVTTFETLHHLTGDTGPAPTRETPTAAPSTAAPAVAMTVVDEAHYVKNPHAQRSRHVTALVELSVRALFLTGTPMENRVGEFRDLLSCLQPDLAAGLQASDQLAGAAAFRRAVAPAYLRRNQADVLTELPEAVHTDEWTEFSPADHAAYHEAVLAGNFQAMRRAAYAHPAQSAKLGRLCELIAEAAAAGEKVLVFSFYRDVLTTAANALGDSGTGPAVFGPLSGATGTAGRQQTVDAFTTHAGPAVLLSQIQAGGVGLNVQAASIVILCEPQVKPALESQAVARAHRMGQTRRVRVHRLLTTNSVDQRLLDLLDRKQHLFDAFVRRSNAAQTSPEALDTTDTRLARRIVDEEQARIASAPRD
ncbi:DEAD/DEAH box helicase [Streptacidiphilus rugosus]|uniref:DEAD/DEAH box helicase n=1 Tax=Streptacidiphilus rugosus TaxID=405783 RepID=UPI00068AF719|nr:DEAD/DEAH box helicase [Streptacidiphilus rugosus]